MFNWSLGQQGYVSDNPTVQDSWWLFSVNSPACWVGMTQLFRKFNGVKLMTIERDTVTWKCYLRVSCRLNELPQGDLSSVGPDIKI